MKDQTYAKKIHRFYFYTKFGNEIYPRFERTNEIEGYVWVGVDKLKKYFFAE